MSTSTCTCPGDGFVMDTGSGDVNCPCHGSLVRQTRGQCQLCWRFAIHGPPTTCEWHSNMAPASATIVEARQRLAIEVLAGYHDDLLVIEGLG